MESVGGRVGTRAIKLQKRQGVLDDIKNNLLSGTSRLENFEMKEEDDVFDVVDEDEYASIVERRRQGNEFVVDDNGNGYRDDGEEVLGVVEDVYEGQKRKTEIIGDEDDDSGGAKKKAQRLSKAAILASSAGKVDTMFSFVKTGAQTSQRIPITAPVTGATEELDIDALLEAPSGDTSTRTSNKTTSILRNKGTAPVADNRSKFLQTSIHKKISLSVDQVRGTHLHAVPRIEQHVPVDDFIHDANDMGDNNLNPEKSGFDVEAECTPRVQVPPARQDSCVSVAKSLNGLREDSTKISFIKGVGRKIKSNSSSLGNSSFTEGNNLLDLDTGAFASISSADSDVALSNGVGNTPIDPALWLRRQMKDENHIEEFEYINMYWTDASELNGIVYLFGKVHLAADAKLPDRYVSCCVAVEGNERNLFVLPRGTGETRGDGSFVRATMEDVWKDLNTKVLRPAVIPSKGEGQGFKVKPVERKYAFEYDDVPRIKTQYLKVKYSAKHGVPSQQVCTEGTEHIQRIFGATSSCLEYFLLKRKLFGPCWIQVKNPRPVQASFSWTKIEIGVDNPKFVSILKTKALAPSLTTMCVSMKTVLNPATHTHEIVAISAVINHDVAVDGETDEDPKSCRSFTLVRQLGTSCGSNYPNVFPHDLSSEVKKVKARFDLNVMPNERAMLDSFFIRLGNEDPDIMVSHNLFGFEFDVLLARAAACKVSAWSKIGRLRKSKVPRSVSERDFAAGRILCDTYKAAKEFLRETTYSLTHLAKSQLDVVRKEVDPVDVPRYFGSSCDIIRVSTHTLHDAVLVMKLMLKLQVIPLTKQLTNLSGNIWNRTIRGARAERIEYLLLHEFHRLKYILPEKKGFGDAKAKGKVNNHNDFEDEVGDNDVPKAGGVARKKGKSGYVGGLVLEPKKGLYDTYILLLDFNSLYPSLIQEYNLCFTTLDWTKYIEDDANGHREENLADVDDLCDENNDSFGAGAMRKGLPPKPDDHLTEGVLPRVIKSLVDRRREVKSLIKNERDDVKLTVLDIRQKALKLTANSMYGCLGFSFSRFYARPIAALVTSMGREALQRTVDLSTNQLKLDVIYGG